jgi:hypothetical protein
MLDVVQKAGRAPPAVGTLLAAAVEPALVGPEAAALPELAVPPAFGAATEPEVEAFDPGDEVFWPPGPIWPVPQAAAAPAPSATRSTPWRRRRRGLMTGSP